MTAQQAIRITEFGIWQFFILTIVAMVLYPGGTLHDAGPDTYSFLNNFFSDLGRTEDFEGNVNPSRWIFTTTVSIVGLAIMGFVLAMPAIFKHDKRFRILKYVAMILGVFAGFGFLGVAFTPYDIRFTGHEISVKGGFLAFFGFAVIMTYMIYQSRYYPNYYGHVFMIFNAILLYYILLLFFGPDARESLLGLHLQVISQKVLIYAQIICMLIQMRGARNILRLQSAA